MDANEFIIIIHHQNPTDHIFDLITKTATFSCWETKMVPDGIMKNKGYLVMFKF